MRSCRPIPLGLTLGLWIWACPGNTGSADQTASGASKNSESATAQTPESPEDGNPLNLPRPVDRNRPGAVLLHGGGQLSDEMVQRFIELAGGKKARIVLVPSGTYVRGRPANGGPEFDESEGDFEKRLAARFSYWIDLKANNRIADFQFLFTDNQKDRDDPRFVAKLEQATGVWIPAGYQGKLAWRFAPKYLEALPAVKNDSLFQIALREVVARGGIVGGYGGGMSALSKIMIMGDTGEDGNPVRPHLDFGLALFDGAIVDQHFDDRRGRLERFADILRDNATLNQYCSWPVTGRNMIGLAVDSRTALLLRGATVAVLGEGSGHVFVKTNGDRTVIWRTLRESDEPCRLVPASRVPHVIARRAMVDPFGMLAPVSKEPPTGKRSGTVVLHGGGSTERMYEQFPALANIARVKFVHCPAASSRWHPSESESNADLQKRALRYFRVWHRAECIDTLTFVTTQNPNDANVKAFVEPLTTADAVWFSGGDQSTLARLFVNAKKPTAFQQELFQVLRRGGVVGGTSAGAAAMAKVMTVSETWDGRSPPTANITHGFGLLNNVVIEQHFLGKGRGGRIERFTGLLRDNEKLRTFLKHTEQEPTPEDMLGLVVEERTALILQENRLKVFGAGNAHVFLKSKDQKTITWHQLEPDDAAYISSDDDGPLLELDDYQVQ